MIHNLIDISMEKMYRSILDHISRIYDQNEAKAISLNQ